MEKRETPTQLFLPRRAHFPAPAMTARKTVSRRRFADPNDAMA
jgi:hypothetical protein